MLALQIGAQDCHHIQKGAHTGDISAAMIADTGATYVMVGHSERRADHNETDAFVRQKALAAQGAGLCPIICIGETLEERESGEAQQGDTRTAYWISGHRSEILLFCYCL